jgi:RimJ/RimL family protein N-acetyltransferase
VTPTAVVETARLTRRPFIVADVEAHAELYSDPDITQHLAGGPVPAEAAAARSRQVVESFVAHWAQHGSPAYSGRRLSRM